MLTLSGARVNQEGSAFSEAAAAASGAGAGSEETCGGRAGRGGGGGVGAGGGFGGRRGRRRFGGPRSGLLVRGLRVGGTGAAEQQEGGESSEWVSRPWHRSIDHRGYECPQGLAIGSGQPKVAAGILPEHLGSPRREAGGPRSRA